MGDFDEIYNAIAEDEDSAAARRWYRVQGLHSFTVFLYDLTCWRVTMMTNYLIIALRNLRKHKGYSLYL